VGASPTILLAGLAAARSGLYEVVGLAAAVPEATIVVRAGEGLEPADALDRPNIRSATPAELELEGIDLVVAPAWCESDLAQIALAARRGIPVVATDRAAGRVRVEVTIPPGDVQALVEAVRSLS
jgi:hypothetical protein